MLILSLKPGDDVVTIDDTEQRITFRFLEKKGSAIRVGIDAPDTVRILRGKLLVVSDDKKFRDLPQ